MCEIIGEMCYVFRDLIEYCETNKLDNDAASLISKRIHTDFISKHIPISIEDAHTGKFYSKVIEFLEKEKQELLQKHPDYTLGATLFFGPKSALNDPKFSFNHIFEKDYIQPSVHIFKNCVNAHYLWCPGNLFHFVYLFCPKDLFTN